MGYFCRFDLGGKGITLEIGQNVKLNEYYHSEYLTNLEYSLDGKTWNVYNKPIDLGNINSKASKTVYIRGHLDAGIVDDTILKMLLH